MLRTFHPCRYCNITHLLIFSHFGKPGTAYDFNEHDIPEAKEKFREVEESQKGLKKKINPKVINTIDTYVALLTTVIFTHADS